MQQKMEKKMQVAENDRLTLHNIFLEQQLIYSNIKSLEKDHETLNKQLETKRSEFNDKFSQVCEKHSLKPELTIINFKTGEIITKEAKDAEHTKPTE